MRRCFYILLCLVCTAAGLGAGRYLWAAPVEDAPVLGPSHRVAAQKPAAVSAEKSIAAVKSGPRRAALMLAMTARGERKNLPALIASCLHDPAMLAMLADLWLDTDPAAFTRALSDALGRQAMPNQAAFGVMQHLLARWSEKDQAAAWRAATATTGLYRRFLRNSLVSEIIKRDPKAGLELVLQNPDLAPATTQEWKPDALRDFLPLIQQFPDCWGKSSLLTSALKDQPLAEAMAAIPPGDYSGRMTQRGILKAAAARSLEEVVTWHETATSSGRYAAAAVIGDKLVQSDPSAAVTWALQHLSGENRVRVLKNAATALETEDPAAAESARALLPQNYSPARNGQ